MSRPVLPISGQLPKVDSARALVMLALRWEDIGDLLSVGEGSLSDDEAEEVLQVMASALVHPAAVDGLIFALPQLLRAVQHRELIETGWVDIEALGYDTVEYALDRASREIEATLWPLLTGLPLDEACHACTREGSPATAWGRQGRCAAHPTLFCLPTRHVPAPDAS